MAQKIPETCIKLEHAVKHIRLLDYDGVDDHTGLKSRPILVECSNGARFRTEHVVSTTLIM